MTYADTLDLRDNDITGIVKGYDLEFLQNIYTLEKAKDIIANDLEMFKKIEESFLNVKEPMSGDFVQYDGKIARLSVIHENGQIQLSNSIGVYVSDSCSQASGCTWDSTITVEKDRLTLKNLEPTSMFIKGRCWTFSGNEAGGGRGVYFEINFKVWNLGKGIKCS